MSWNKGKHHEKEVIEEEFTACVKGLSDVITTFEPKAGVAALGYMVACVQITMPKKNFDRIVEFYVSRIKTDILDKLKDMDPERLKDIKAELMRQMKRSKP